MFFDINKYWRREIEWLKKDIEIHKDISSNWKDVTVSKNRTIDRLENRNNYLRNTLTSTELELNHFKFKYEKIKDENKKLKEEINNMKPKRNFDIGQLIEYRGDVYEVQSMMQVCVVLSGVSSKVKCTLITVDRNSSELIEL